MTVKRVHILSAVNAANVSKSGGTYTIKDVCGAIDGIVMNGRMYPGDQLAAGVESLSGKPAPAGHPKNAAGQHISALNGEALASAWIGSYAKNARHEGGRTLADILVNEAQAKAHPDGMKLIERLDAAIAGTNAEPIHVSTGLNLVEIKANGESMGKKYSSIATNLQYDHLAILLNEQGAGTPAQGVGMFLNSEGQAEEVETVTVNTLPEDKRYEGLTGWIRKLLGNSELSFEQISEGIRKLLPESTYVQEVFARYVVWVNYQSNMMYRQDYSVGSDGSVAFTSDPIEVIREVKYKPVENSETKDDSVKTHILAALNAAGIQTAGLDDTQILTAYNAYIAKPYQEATHAANAKVATFEANANAAENAEILALSTEMAVNSSLTVDDLQKLGLARLKEIKGNAKVAAPIVLGAPAAKPASEFAGYDMNAINKEGAK
jgi:hypothetical protein